MSQVRPIEMPVSKSSELPSCRLDSIGSSANSVMPDHRASGCGARAVAGDDLEFSLCAGLRRPQSLGNLALPASPP